MVGNLLQLGYSIVLENDLLGPSALMTGLLTTNILSEKLLWKPSIKYCKEGRVAVSVWVSGVGFWLSHPQLFDDGNRGRYWRECSDGKRPILLDVQAGMTKRGQNGKYFGSDLMASLCQSRLLAIALFLQRSACEDI